MKLLPAFLLLLSFGLGVRAQSFDAAAAHNHRQRVTQEFRYAGREAWPSSRFVFLGNVVRVEDSSGRSPRFFYPLDLEVTRGVLSVWTLFYLEAARPAVWVTYDPVCMWASSISLTPPPAPKVRAAPAGPPRRVFWKFYDLR